jgi:hypothetical protein
MNESPAPALAEELNACVFADNLLALGLRPRTRELVEGASARGRVARLRDGTPVLHVDGQLLGMPSEDISRADADSAVVVFGLGVGHTVRALRSVAERRILVYEPDPGILRTALESGPTDLGDVDIVCTLTDLSEHWADFSRGRVNATLVKTPGYAQAFPDHERQLTETVTRLVSRAGVNINTYRARARTWIQDVLDNLDVLCEVPLFQALAGRYKNVPAFIVGAGPSLGKNGQLLAEAQKKGIVFAVNSSGRALASYGVEPQVLACMESIDVSHLIADLPFIDRVVRAFALTGSPKTFHTGRGPLLPLYEALPELNAALEELTGQQGLSVCASISTVAFSLAQRLGCSPIVLVGQDLAYTDGRAYARGTVYEDSRVRVSDGKPELVLDWCETAKHTHARADSRIRQREPLEEIAAWGGGGARVASGTSFTPIRMWLEHAAGVIREALPDVRLVNATEGGAHLAGFEETTLADVIAPLPELNITSSSIARDAAELAPIGRARVLDWLEEQRALTRKVEKAAERMHRIAERAVRAVESGKPTRISKTFAALERAEAELKQHARKSRLVETWCFTELHDKKQTVQRASGNAEADALWAVQHGAELGRLIQISAQELGKAFAHAAERLASKQQRNAKCPS